MVFKIRQNPFSAGALPLTPLGSSRCSPRLPIRLEGDTPHHTTPHSAPTHLRRSPCVAPQNSSRIYAYGYRHRTKANPICHVTYAARWCSQNVSQGTVERTYSANCRKANDGFWASHPCILLLIVDAAGDGARYGNRTRQSRVPDRLPHRRSGLIAHMLRPCGLRKGLIAAASHGTTDVDIAARDAD